MSEPLVFSVDGDPRPKGRPRATIRGEHAAVYTDKKTRAYEAAVATIARSAMRGRKPFVGALSVSLRFRVGLPKSMSKRDRLAYLSGERAYMDRNDLDNYAKAVLDACNTICFIDDRQVVRLFATKTASEKAGIDVKIQPLEPE